MKKKLLSAAVVASFAFSSAAAYANNPPSNSFIPDFFRCGFFNFAVPLAKGHWPMTCPW